MHRSATAKNTTNNAAVEAKASMILIMIVVFFKLLFLVYLSINHNPMHLAMLAIDDAKQIDAVSESRQIEVMGVSFEIASFYESRMLLFIPFVGRNLFGHIEGRVCCYELN